MHKLILLMNVLELLCFGQASFRSTFDEQWNDLSQWVIITGVPPTVANHLMSTHLASDEIVTTLIPGTNLFKLYADDGDSSYSLEFQNVSANGPQSLFTLIGTGTAGSFILNYPGFSVACDVAAGIPVNHFCAAGPEGVFTIPA